jgi:hypothetical protein
MAEDKIYRTALPDPLSIGDCYLYKTQLIAEFFEKDGSMETYVFHPPDRWYPIDLNWLDFEYADLGGFDYPQSLPLFIFEEYVEHQRRQYLQEKQNTENPDSD